MEFRAEMRLEVDDDMGGVAVVAGGGYTGKKKPHHSPWNEPCRTRSDIRAAATSAAPGGSVTHRLKVPTCLRRRPRDATAAAPASTPPLSCSAPSSAGSACRASTSAAAHLMRPGTAAGVRTRTTKLKTGKVLVLRLRATVVSPTHQGYEVIYDGSCPPGNPYGIVDVQRRHTSAAPALPSPRALSSPAATHAGAVRSVPTPAPAAAAVSLPSPVKMVGLAREEALAHDEVIMDDADSDVEVSDSEDDSGEEAQATPSENAIYNKVAILEKLEDIAWPKNVDWMHKLTIEHDQGGKVDVNDDLARELAFYTQALDGTRQAFEKLQSMKVRFLRPTDYYAEMVKTDAHMHKIKGRLLSEKRRIEEAEERKKAREAKKIAKEVQAEKNKQRAKDKKEQIESVKKWRKQRQQGGFAKGNDDVPDLNFEGEEGFKQSKKKRPGVSPGDRSGGLAKRGKEGKNRRSRDAKFGHGGRKGLKKQNTAETTNDFRSYKGGESQTKKRKRS
nr:unnamed protein product [Digitaria exilis]